MLPVVLGEIASEGLGDHLVDALPALAVEIGGVNQACGVDLEKHTPCLPVWLPGPHHEKAELCDSSPTRDRGRAQCRRTRWPARTWATLSMSSSITTPTTGSPPVIGWSGPRMTGNPLGGT